jgi:hypothetical protein
MVDRLGDKFCQFESGVEKRKLKMTKEHHHERQKSSLFNFLIF